MTVHVWAPCAEAVLLHRERGPLIETDPLSRAPGGWWTGGTVAHGDDYGFIVDGEGPYPDPRSAAQPHGVHGLSRAWDASEFAWSDSEWHGVDGRGTVHYELHVGTFTAEGTLDSAATELPRLAAAGVGLVELMPVAPFPGDRGWGYDGVGMYAVHGTYGGPDALQRFVDAAHRNGIGVCLDVVFNHQGPDGNYLGVYGPYFTAAHQTPWGHGANLDGKHSGPVRDHIIGAALRWFEDFHIDALRLDAVHALVDNSPRHLLAELADAVASLEERVGRPLSLIAESDLNDPAFVTPTAEDGLGQTLQWADDVHHALHAYLTGERHGYYVDFGSVEVLDHVFRNAFWHDGRWSPFRGKNWGAPVPAGLDRRRFVVYASNHDQVGNRPYGDRPAATLSPGAQATSMALVLLGPFTPMLFMGEEYGETAPFLYFTDHEPVLGAAVTSGRVAEFSSHGLHGAGGSAFEIPDPQDPATRDRSVLVNARNPNEPFASMRAWMGTCMALRHRTLATGAWDTHPVAVTEPAERVLVLHGPVSVHANLSAAPVQFPMEPGRTLVGAFGEAVAGDGILTIAPDAVALTATENESPAAGAHKEF